MREKRKLPAWLATVGKLLLAALALVLMALVLLRLFPHLFAVLRTGDVEQIEGYLRGTDRLACVAALVIMLFFQVVSVVVPALPIRIAAGAVLDTLPGFLVCWLSFLLANFCVFEVVRHLGGPLHERVRHFVLESKTAAPLRKLMDTDHAGLFVVIANIIPFLPNGIIPYAASMTDLKTGQFLAAVALGSALPALADCTLGAAVLGGNLILTAVSYGALFALAYLLYRNRRKVAQWIAQK